MAARLLSSIAAAAALLCAGPLASAAGAADLYLSPTGVNSGNCQTQAQPCGSFNYVQSQASATPEADTVHLTAGDYLPDTSFMTVAKVTWSGPQAGVPAQRQSGDTARIAVTNGGFGFIVQADDIAFDGVTFQSQNYAAADGSFGLYSLNPTTVRNSVFTHLRTGVYAGSSIVTSGLLLETINDAMYFTGDSATISDTTFSPAAAYAGLISGGNGPLTITDSSFTSGTYGFLTYAGTNLATLTGNSFSPSIANGLYNDGGPVDARRNWWGCNAGPNGPGCATLTGPGTVNQTTIAPRLVLGASVDPASVSAGSTATVTAALDHDSAGDPFATDFPGASVGFATTLGTFGHASAPLARGAATATLTTPLATGTADMTATLDGETVHVPLEVTEAPPTIAADGGVTAARSGTSLPVSGTGHPGTAVQVKVNGAAVGLPVTVTPEGTWSASVTLVDGDNALQVQRGLFVADGPTVVGVYAPPLSSPQAGDEVFPTPTVEGSGLAGAAIAVADESGTPIGSGTVAPGGSFAVALDPLSEGPHTLHVTQTFDGVESAESTVAVTVVPVPPEVTLPLAGAHVRPRFSIRGSAHSDVALTVLDEDDTEIAAATATATGAWALRTTAPLTDGPHTLTILETYGAFVLRSALSVVVDPAAPLLAAPTLALDGPATVLPGATVALAGRALPHAVVLLRHDGAAAGDAVADASGDWTASVTTHAGDNAFTATQELAGADPGESAESAAAHATGVGTPSVSSPGSGDLVQATFEVAGDALPGATVTVAAGATTLATATADATSGAWSATTSTPLAYGDHTLSISQRLDGVSGADASLAVTVVPPAPTLTHPDGSELGDGAIEVAGTADPHAAVDLFLDGGATSAQSTTAGADGAFAVTLAATRGVHTVTASQRVGGSLSGPLSTARSVEVLPARPTLQLDSAATVAAGDPIVVSGTAEPGATVSVARSAGASVVTTFTTTADAISGEWSRTLRAASRVNTLSARQQPGGAGSISLPSRPDVVVTATPLLAPPAFTLPATATTGAFTITGSARPGATVSGSFDGAAKSTTADGNGAWSLSVSVRTGAQTAVFHQAAEVDGVAETSDDSAVQTLTGVPAPDPDPDPTDPTDPTDPRPTDPTPPGPTPTNPVPAPTPTDPAPPGPTPAGPTPTPAVPASAFSLAKPTVRGTAIALALTLPRAGRVKVTATVALKGKRIAYGSAAAKVATAGAKRLTLKPGRRAKAALRGVRAAKVTLTVTFTPSGGRAVVKTARVTVSGGRRR
ncbi:Ig-like domain-containing protein [Conexibacter sp. JD483]|uniref:Ig-like domain-containing protein n=1 Tax=unclassified Conexibacter TaxID=2627773 RepID=UPI00271E1241|nr:MULTISPECIES: Ig-like domain-containing protein [unclassified Conexibacter]MDO8188600.1 Ig-like domain-containing protein [Conexibacter sp. CPCC 205706]MDO8201490.1 Ig-like domain-containing protein [Conexibacter sp. CPCC 205762]MDR9370857.1 Ig-like domain-containing protein [Conexibacter sp. JD483]